MISDQDPFGARPLPEPMERLRRFGQTLGTGRAARIVCSGIRRVVTLGRQGPYDVEAFPGQFARLYPSDNLSDKRVFGAVQFWDGEERAALAEAVAAAPDQACFVDAGANAGLYTLAARSVAGGKPLRVLAIEPDPTNVRRLRFNLAASRAEDDVVVAEVALGDSEGQVRIGGDDSNRGELTVGETGSPVALRPLLSVVQWAGFSRIDALKIDIEGMENTVLSHFFATAPRALWPGMVILEAQRGAVTDALGLLLDKGYGVRTRTRMNAILVRAEALDPAAS